MITQLTNVRERSRLFLAAEAGERFALSLTTGRAAIGVLETHNAAPAEYLAGRRCTHTYSGYGSAVPASSVDDRPEAVLLRRAKLLFIADTVGGRQRRNGTTLLPSGKSEGFGQSTSLDRRRVLATSAANLVSISMS